MLLFLFGGEGRRTSPMPPTVSVKGIRVRRGVHLIGGRWAPWKWTLERRGRPPRLLGPLGTHLSGQSRPVSTNVRMARSVASPGSRRACPRRVALYGVGRDRRRRTALPRTRLTKGRFRPSHDLTRGPHGSNRGARFFTQNGRNRSCLVAASGAPTGLSGVPSESAAPSPGRGAPSPGRSRAA